MVGELQVLLEVCRGGPAAIRSFVASQLSSRARARSKPIFRGLSSMAVTTLALA